MNFLQSIFGKKPNLPAWQSLDLGTEQQKAISANTAAMPGAEKLVAESNLFSQQQTDQMLQGAIPGFSTMKGQASADISSMLKGEIPKDVSDAVQNSAAARSLGMGFGGSGMSRSLVARDLGLTSLDLTQKGLSSAQSWMQTMNQLYAPGQINLSSMFITPQQQAGFSQEERNMGFEHDWLGNQIAAMPDPVWSGIHEDVMSLAKAFLGGSGMGKAMAV
jgi:hypothetical protein